MTWRDPRSPREGVRIDCDSLRELADTYQPFIRWSDQERFFPALAEAWLQHATSAPWPAKRSPVSADVETGIDAHRRGTAVCTADVDVTNVHVVAGTPNPDDMPISLNPEDLAATLAGHLPGGSETFLDFAGWDEHGLVGFRGASGDLDYLYRAFSELAAAINPAMPWQPVELMAHLPTFWTPQPPTPTVYCEARLATDFAALSDAMAQPDYAPGSGEVLANVLVLTYHYFYPAREPSDGEPAVRAKEGQWEAVSIYFRANVKGDESSFSEPPLAVAISQGNDGPAATPMVSDFRPWADVHREDTHAHPILFAARGSHRFFFAPLEPGQTYEPGAGGPTVPAGSSYDNNSDFPGWEVILLGGLILAWFFLSIGLWPVAIVVAVIAFLLWLISLIADLCNDDSENPANPTPSNPETQGNGPQAGDSDEPPAPGSPGGDGSSGGGGGLAGGFGLPNSGSPQGADTSSFDLRFIDGVTREVVGRPRYTGYPSATPCEHPTWWDFTGRWGVRVAPSLAGTWASGDQRVDEHGRSWGYWHTLRFFEERLLGNV